MTFMLSYLYTYCNTSKLLLIFFHWTLFLPKSHFEYNFCFPWNGATNPSLKGVYIFWILNYYTYAMLQQPIAYIRHFMLWVSNSSIKALYWPMIWSCTTKTGLSTEMYQKEQNVCTTLCRHIWQTISKQSVCRYAWCAKYETFGSDVWMKIF